MTASGRLFLDSADLDHARAAAESGLVAGITTNPTIMGAAGRPPMERLADLLETFAAGPVFHQLTSRTEGDVEAEVACVRDAARAHVDRLVLKLPAQPRWYHAGATFAGRGWSVAFTAVYDAGQAVCAVESGATWIIPYVDRSARLEPDAPGIIGRLRPFVPTGVRLLAASLKTPSHALNALSDGADAVTTSWGVIGGLMHHPLTDTAVEEFERAPGHWSDGPFTSR